VHGGHSACIAPEVKIQRSRYHSCQYMRCRCVYGWLIRISAFILTEWQWVLGEATQFAVVLTSQYEIDRAVLSVEMRWDSMRWTRWTFPCTNGAHGSQSLCPIMLYNVSDYSTWHATDHSRQWQQYTQSGYTTAAIFNQITIFWKRFVFFPAGISSACMHSRSHAYWNE